MYLPTFSKLVNLLGERQEHFASELRLGSALLLFSIDLLVSSRFGLHTPFRLYMFIAQRNFSVKPQGVAPYWRIVNSPHDDVWLVKSTTAENKLCVIAVELRVAIAIRLLAGASYLDLLQFYVMINTALYSCLRPVVDAIINTSGVGDIFSRAPENHERSLPWILRLERITIGNRIDISMQCFRGDIVMLLLQNFGGSYRDKMRD